MHSSGMSLGPGQGLGPGGKGLHLWGSEASCCSPTYSTIPGQHASLPFGWRLHGLNGHMEESEDLRVYCAHQWVFPVSTCPFSNVC